MNESLFRNTEDHIRFVSVPSHTSMDRSTADEIRMIKTPELIYLSCLVVFDLIAKICCACITILTPDTGVLKWVIVCYAMASYNLFKVIFHLIYFVIWSEKIHTHRFKAIYRAIYALNFALISMGMGLYLENKIYSSGLYGFAIMSVIFATFIFVIETIRKSEYSLVAFYNILESVQILLIYINLSFPGDNYNWAYTLFIYYFVSLTYFMISIVCFIALMIIVFNNYMHANEGASNPGNAKQATESMVYDVLFYIIWNGYAYHKIVKGFDSLFTEFVIVPGWQGPCFNDSLGLGFHVILVCGVISLILWIISVAFKRECLKELLYWIR